jgi:hypothetical protein
MNNDPRHDAVRDDLPAYALDGLSPEEMRAVEEHLAECASCREELLSYGPIPHALDLAVPEADLPEGARERLLQRTLTPVHAVPDFDETSSQVQTPRRRPPTIPWALAAASLLLAVVLGGGFLQQSRKAAEQQATIDSVVDLMERADLEVRDLPTPDSEARLRVYEAQEGDVGMVVVDKLPDPPEGKEYQLWVGRGEELENEGTFVPTDAQRGSYHKLLKPPEGFARYDRVGITTVPEGGIESPPPASDPDWVVRAKL